jgi:hypothetical protein
MIHYRDLGQQIDRLGLTQIAPNSKTGRSADRASRYSASPQEGIEACSMADNAISACLSKW